MLCYRCKKRPAVVFISNDKNSSNAQGLCLTCAKELGIKPINYIMENMGVSEDELNAMEEQFSDFLSSQGEEHESDDSEDEDNGFTVGGATTFPFIKGIFSNMPFMQNSESEKDDKKDSKESKIKKKPKRKHLDMYCYNLTKRARDGELDKIIGRDKEISRVIQILSRRTKNNPCLIGEPGVGKTAIAEGLAIRIAEGNVPLRLKNKEIHLLDLTALVAGTQFRGQFESRIKGLIDEVKKDGNIILFIDEVHNLVGAGDSESSMNAANILKPSLSRGEIQVIGATTFKEYRKYIEKDSALERRFQPVKVLEPSIIETVNVLKGIKNYYEEYHRVTLPDELVRKAVVLSERYITDRFLPDKAIDLLDEACACAALRNKDMSEYDKINEDIAKIKDEEEKVLAEGAEANEEELKKLAQLRCDLANLEKRASEIKDSALGSKVEEKDLAHVIELWTGIPSAKIQENEFKKLETLEEKLKERVIGQNQAVSAVSAAIRRNRVQISPRRRPSSFIFVGSTGVGKTELVKVLAEELFNTPDALIRLDMSEFMEKHSVSRIIGAPPGYVGYDEAGQVTEKVRQRPYSVILFDEIEKAHPDVLNILLQILDEGKVTDAQGRAVNFENTVIVMTSNAGSDKKGGSLGFGKSQNDMTKEKVMKALSEFLRPEFLSRVDEVIVFNNLTEENYVEIAKLILNEYVDVLSERGVDFDYDDSALRLLAKKSFNGKSGARDLRKLIRKEVEDKLASIIVENGGFTMSGVRLTGDEELQLKVV